MVIDDLKDFLEENPDVDKFIFACKNKNFSNLILTSDLEFLKKQLINRKRIYLKIHKLLTEENKIVVISGQSGLGKTTLVNLYREYLLDKLLISDVKIIQSNNKEKVYSAFRSIKKSLNKKDTNELLVERLSLKDIIQNMDEKFLLVFDNVENITDILSAEDLRTMDRHKKIQIVITTTKSYEELINKRDQLY